MFHTFKFFSRVGFFTLLVMSAGSIYADTGEAHLKKFKQGVAGDAAIAAAEKLNVKIPIEVREWHVWWGAPIGSKPHMPIWVHWKGQRIFGKFNQDTTIEKTRPGSQWRRWLNCIGYPLLGPYDSSQPDIIRWQLETARNAGIECLHLQLWPSIWDEGIDFTPLPIFDTIMETAAKLKYPVAVHDEIQFRRPKIGKAQTLESSIKRSILLLKRYGQHPGWYKIKGMPVYYFQNWSKWITAEDMEKYFATVEKEVGPVYWIVEMSDIDKYFKVPQVKALVSHNNGWVLHDKPKKLLNLMQRSAAKARKYGKKFGVMVRTRFNHTYDRGNPDDPRIVSGKNGMYMVDSVALSLKSNPDFIILTQWNDFEEGGFIEPAWDFDGFNGDPYRYCRITAALTGKTFVPARLPARDQLDPFIRTKLFGDIQPGDMGPVFQTPEVLGKLLNVAWAKEANPKNMSFLQKQLATWRPGVRQFNGAKLRLANYSAVTGYGLFLGKSELRFYAPGLVSETPLTLWLGIRVGGKPDATKLNVFYRSRQELYRRSSTWNQTKANFQYGYAFDMGDGSVFYWTPLHDAMLNGREGDLTIRLGGSRGNTYIREMVIWSPQMVGEQTLAADSMKIPNSVSTTTPFVTVAYDEANNPGPPMLILPKQAGNRQKTVLQKISEETEVLKRTYKDSVLLETFTNLKRWRKISGVEPALITYAPEKKGVPFLSLPISVVETDLPEPMSSLSLKIDIFNTIYKRAQWVALFDNDYKHGIGFIWDSSQQSIFSGQGYVNIIIFDLAGKPEIRSEHKKIGKRLNSGMEINQTRPLTFTMNVSPENIELCFGEKKIKVANPIKKSFNKIVIRGSKGYFDNLIISKK